MFGNTWFSISHEQDCWFCANVLMILYNRSINKKLIFGYIVETISVLSVFTQFCKLYLYKVLSYFIQLRMSHGLFYRLRNPNYFIKTSIIKQ